MTRAWRITCPEKHTMGVIRPLATGQFDYYCCSCGEYYQHLIDRKTDEQVQPEV